MGLPGVSARGVSGPGRAPPYSAVPARRDGKGGRGTVTSGTDADLSSEPRKSLKTVYFQRFPGKLEQ